MTEQPPDERPPKRRRRRKKDTPWYRDPVIVIPLVGALIGAIVGSFQIYDKCCADKPAPVSVQYVVDTSRGMAGTISGRPKLEVVKAVLLRHVEDEEKVAHGLTLAPPCAVGANPQRIDTDTGNADDFKAALEGVAPKGRADLARSIGIAANDLLEQEQEGTQRSVLILLVGGRDPCGGAVAALEDALDLLTENSVKLRISLRRSQGAQERPGVPQAAPHAREARWLQGPGHLGHEHCRPQNRRRGAADSDRDPDLGVADVAHDGPSRVDRVVRARGAGRFGRDAAAATPTCQRRCCSCQLRMS